jgi:hypothetical protein
VGGREPSAGVGVAAGLESLTVRVGSSSTCRPPPPLKWCWSCTELEGHAGAPGCFDAGQRCLALREPLIGPNGQPCHIEVDPARPNAELDTRGLFECHEGRVLPVVEGRDGPDSRPARSFSTLASMPDLAGRGAEFERVENAGEAVTPVSIGKCDSAEDGNNRLVGAPRTVPASLIAPTAYP